MAPVLDHLVIDVRDRMAAGAARMAALGFQLTPMGKHSLGSANHLAVFGEDYLELLGTDAEFHASARVRTEEALDWPAWAERVNLFLDRMHGLFWPDLFILGGAVSENFAAFGPLLKSPAEIRPAQFTGQAGVIGAALAAANLAR